MGGAIRKPILKKKKRDEKIQEALDVQASKMGGGLMFHSPTHKYLHEKLSGRGGSFDSPFVRKKMHQLMTRHHPALFQTYATGRVTHLKDEWHDKWHPPPTASTPSKTPHVRGHGRVSTECIPF